MIATVNNQNLKTFTAYITLSFRFLYLSFRGISLVLESLANLSCTSFHKQEKGKVIFKKNLTIRKYYSIFFETLKMKVIQFKILINVTVICLNSTTLGKRIFARTNFYVFFLYRIIDRCLMVKFRVDIFSQNWAVRNYLES